MLEMPHHAWIKEDTSYFRVFNIILNLLKLESLERICSYKNFAFIKVEGHLSCAIEAKEDLNFIICFPELLQYLKSASPDTAMAILLHELGHLYHAHSRKEINNLSAQKQADEFAMYHGHGNEIISIINDYRHLEENRLRIKNIEFKMREMLSPKS